MEAHPPARDDVDRRPRELVHPHEPLQRDQRLDPLAGAVRERDRVRVVLGAREQPLLAQLGDDRRLGLGGGQAGEALAAPSPVIRPSSPITLELLEAVAAADLEVVGVVAGRDLQRAGAELGLDVVVGDDRQPAPDERQDRGLADEPR